MDNKLFQEVVLFPFIFLIIIIAGCTSNKQSSDFSPSLDSSSAILKDWKMHSGERFLIMYPPNWQKTDDGQEGLILDGKEQGVIEIRYFGDDLNFGDGPRTNKMGLDQFMEFAKNNDAFQNVKHTSLNSYNAYEIDVRLRVSTDGINYQEQNLFTIMTENKGHVYQINFKNRSGKSQLTQIDIDILSTFKFTN